MAEKNNHTRRLLFNALGLFFSVIPPAVSIFSYFPIWVAREDASVLSGLSLVLIIAALIPCYKYVKEALRTASVPFMWLGIFLVFYAALKDSTRDNRHILCGICQQHGRRGIL